MTMIKNNNKKNKLARQILLLIEMEEVSIQRNETF